MSALPTGSGVHRAMNCPASCALPGAGRTTEATIAGNENHAEMEQLANLLKRLTAAGLREDPDHSFESERAALLLHVVFGGTILGVERTYCLDVVTGKARILGDALARDYSKKTANEIALTVDLAIRLPNGSIRIVDWKSRKRVYAAYENWQLRSAIMAAVQCEAHEDGADHEICIGYLDNGEIDRAIVNALDINEWWHDVFALRDKLRGAPQTMIHEGPWCEYCPAMAHCPTQTRLALAMLGELDVAAQVQEMTDEQAGRAYVTAKRAEDLLDRIQSALKTRAKSNPIPLPNGKRLVMVEYPGRESLDREEVERVFGELGKPLPMKRGQSFTQPREQK